MEITQELTIKQRNILEFIQNKIKQGSVPPTIREIARHFGFSSTGTVRDYLKSLTKKGYLKITPKKSRYIELSRSFGFKIPILGRVNAGIPNLAFEEIEDYLNLDELLQKADQQIFALRIKGDSLIEAGIFEDDLVLIKKQSLARDKDFVVALIDNEVTVKRFRQKQGKTYLEAANKKYPTINKEFSIIGRVITVLRKL